MVDEVTTHILHIMSVSRFMQAASPWEQSVADMWAKDRGGGGGHTNTSYQVSEAGAADAIGKVTSSATGDPSSSSSSGGGGGGTLTSSQQQHHHQSEGDPPQRFFWHNSVSEEKK